MSFQSIDQNIFKLINQSLSNPVFDAFFPAWTDVQKTPLFFIVVFAVLIRFIFRKKWNEISLLVMCALGVFLAGSVNRFLIKPFFERPRPVDVILRVAKETSFSFPSGHATNAFCIAVFLCLGFPRYRIYFLIMATLTAYSRVYCGVHYPGDVMAGAALGSICAFGIFKLWMKGIKPQLKFLPVLFIGFFSFNSFSFEDPTQGKPFFPWLWEDQFKPTLVKSVDQTGLILLASGAVSTVGVHQYDRKIYNFSEDGGNLWMDHKSAEKFGSLGNGMAGVVLVGTQIYFDQKNGLRSARALILTTVTHTSVAAIVQRDRPMKKKDFLPFPSSFPSGHTSSAFAVAGSLAYSYGWVGAIPGYLAATGIAVSRIKENRHWASDIVAGAFIGTFWARASFAADEMDREAFFVLPVPVYDGMMLSAVREF